MLCVWLRLVVHAILREVSQNDMTYFLCQLVVFHVSDHFFARVDPSGCRECAGLFVEFACVCTSLGQAGVYYTQLVELHRRGDGAKRCVGNCCSYDVVGGWRVSGVGDLAVMLEHDHWTSYVRGRRSWLILYSFASKSGTWHPFVCAQNGSRLAAHWSVGWATANFLGRSRMGWLTACRSVWSQAAMTKS